MQMISHSSPFRTNDSRTVFRLTRSYCPERIPATITHSSQIRIARSASPADRHLDISTDISARIYLNPALVRTQRTLPDPSARTLSLNPQPGIVLHPVRMTSIHIACTPKPDPASFVPNQSSKTPSTRTPSSTRRPTPAYSSPFAPNETPIGDFSLSTSRIKPSSTLAAISHQPHISSRSQQTAGGRHVNRMAAPQSP